MDDSELFQQIGFTKNEGKSYKVLTEFGKLSASEISSKSGVPYSRIYDVLASLVNKGFVEIVPEKTKKFIPSSPDSLLKVIGDKKKILEKSEKLVNEMKRFYESKEKNPVIFAQGAKGFWKLAEEMKPTVKRDYNIKWKSDVKPDSFRNTTKNLRRGVDVRILSRVDDETRRNVHKWIKINKNIRKIENKGIAVSIRDEEVLISLIKNNLTLLVRDSNFAEIMGKLFLAYYETAEKIKP